MKEEAPLQKLKKLVGESSEIRKGNLSGKKKKIAKKMKFRLTEKQKQAMWKRDGVRDKEERDDSGANYFDDNSR